jgi:hypothetical protein
MFLIYDKQNNYDVEKLHLEELEEVKIQFDADYPIWCACCKKEYQPKYFKRHYLSKLHLKNLKKSKNQ